MNLIVVESPTKAKTLSRFLGKDYVLEATMGHIKDLPKSKLGVNVEEDFAPKYLILKNKSKSIKIIKDQARKVKKVYLATDPDREGEAIAQHVYEVLRSNAQFPISNDQLKRIVFHEITEKAVLQAIENPRGIDKNLVDAQIARRVLDRLVGYKLSPLLWKKVRRGLSAGRVQTVAVRLIVEREREIKAFKPEEYWEIFAQVVQVEKVVQVEQESFIVKLIKVEDKKAEVKDGKTAKAIVSDLKKSSYKVFDVEKREVKKYPFPPFTTSTMTQSAARLFYWSTKRTMSIAQKLYEEGLITYHRTDSTNLAKTAVFSTRDFIKEKFGNKYLPKKPNVYRTKSKVAQEAHEAIRPTDVGKIPNSKFQIPNKGAKKLYDLIWKRFVACQMVPSVYDETKIDVEALRQAQGKQKRYLLQTSGQVLKFDGWKKVFEKTPSGETRLPDVKKGEPLQLIKVDSQQKFTEPPARYGEALLIKTLEKLGIGRPSTYAPIIYTIQIRNYVEKIEGKFHPTSIGITVNDFLIKYFPKIFEYSFTAKMEDNLDNVANGKHKWVAMMKDFYRPFEEKLEKVTEKSKRVKIETEKLEKKCPECAKKGLPASRRGDLVIRIGRFGKFISCSRFPDCKHTERFIEKIGIKCPECGKGDVIVKTTRKGKKFYGCSRFPDCKWASWRKPTSQNTKFSS